MLILELSRKSGVSRHTIRYYEKLGMIKARDRRENSYKEYGEEALYSLLFVDRVKRLGFSLAEIKDFLQTLGRSRKTASEIIESKLESRIQDLDNRIAELSLIRSDVAALLHRCRTNPYKGQEGLKELVESLEKKSASIKTSTNSHETEASSLAASKK